MHDITVMSIESIYPKLDRFENICKKTIKYIAMASDCNKLYVER